MAAAVMAIPTQHTAEAAAQELLVAMELRAVVLLLEQAALDQMPIQLGHLQQVLGTADTFLVVVEVETVAGLEDTGQAEVLAEEEVAAVKSHLAREQSPTTELMDRQTLVAVQVVDTQAAVLAS
jgi:hypothetical protein